MPRGNMAKSDEVFELSNCFRLFMRYFLAHVNPILHRADYLGRTYSENEIVVLMALSLCGAMRPTDLAKGLSMQKGSLTPVFRRLRELDLVSRSDIPNNERSYRLELTAEGEAFVRVLDAQRDAGFAALFGGMRSEDLVAATRAIEALTSHLQGVEEGRVQSIQEASGQ